MEKGFKSASLRNIVKTAGVTTGAFVGQSGGGKSTLANLITRFFDADSGEVLIGGVNVKNISKDDLMNTVSFVFQNSKLIDASIFDNVRLAKPDADLDEVMSALKKAIDIIEKFNSGVDTIIGSNGVYLSGGEAILKNASIVILDEVTAFADPDNEVKIQKALDELSKDKTVILIAHRMRAVEGADKIVVLSNGTVAECDSPNELMQKDGIFKHMAELQSMSRNWTIQ